MPPVARRHPVKHPQHVLSFAGDLGPGAMIEFLIRRTDGEWFDLDSSRNAEVLKPRSVSSEPVSGWGDHRIKIPNGVISFSYEDPGIQVMFDEFSASREEARLMVEEILSNIEAATGQRGRIVDL
jgi:hypothetical protein